MNYKILARKWRPQKFSQVCGHKYVIKAITNSIKLNKIHHAWVFSGTRGTGKTTIARILAKSLSCYNSITANPCRKCVICKNIEKHCFSDFIEVDGASKTKVEDIKEMLSTVYYSPLQGRFKIYLIDEIHMLSKHSFNALLKILEEPPKHVKFIFATTEIEKIPNTILSRCLIFKLNDLKFIEIYNFISKILKKENIQIEPEALKIVSNYSLGSIRDALNFLEQSIYIDNKKILTKTIINLLGTFNEEIIFKITKSIIKKNITKTFEKLNQCESSYVNWDYLLVEILKIFHFISMIKLYPSTLKNNYYMSSFKNELLKIASKLSFNQLKLYYKTILHGRSLIYLAPTKKIGIEMLVLEILHL
ncbi:DNA polymerase III subunit tau, partial [isoform gamma] [Buchnera aphidicola (Anoecia corni)]|uniref:DNA polymerase III subunit gamma/tau n=1 Tax=Buchnera aphidicola (Anoecia corni) TaxID=2994477 RepID=A0AAT9IH58_9GAMM